MTFYRSDSLRNGISVTEMAADAISRCHVPNRMNRNRCPIESNSGSSSAYNLLDTEFPEPVICHRPRDPVEFNDEIVIKRGRNKKIVKFQSFSFVKIGQLGLRSLILYELSQNRRVISHYSIAIFFKYISYLPLVTKFSAKRSSRT